MLEARDDNDGVEVGVNGVNVGVNGVNRDVVVELINNETHNNTIKESELDSLATG